MNLTKKQTNFVLAHSIYSLIFVFGVEVDLPCGEKGYKVSAIFYMN